MSIFRGFKFFRLILVILVSLVSLTISPLKGYCDDWVFVDNNKDYTTYYNSSSIRIYKQQKIIKVWGKDVYTKKGKDDLLKYNIDGIDKRKYSDFNHALTLFLFDYKEWKMSLKTVTYYSNSGDVLFDKNYVTKWNNMKPDSESDLFLKKILKDNNIQR